MTISECVRSSPWWGVVKSLGYYRRGPVGLVHTQKIEAQSEKPTWTKALEFTQFACPCGTDPRLLSGEQRTSHFKLVTSVDDPNRTSLRFASDAICGAGATAVDRVTIGSCATTMIRPVPIPPSRRIAGCHVCGSFRSGRPRR